MQGVWVPSRTQNSLTYKNPLPLRYGQLSQFIFGKRGSIKYLYSLNRIICPKITCQLTSGQKASSADGHPHLLLLRAPVPAFWEKSAKRTDCQLTHEPDPSNQRLLSPSPVFGMWVSLASPAPRGGSKDTALRQ